MLIYYKQGDAHESAEDRSFYTERKICCHSPPAGACAGRTTNPPERIGICYENFISATEKTGTRCLNRVPVLLYFRFPADDFRGRRFNPMLFQNQCIDFVSTYHTAGRILYTFNIRDNIQINSRIFKSQCRID